MTLKSFILSNSKIKAIFIQIKATHRQFSLHFFKTKLDGVIKKW